MHPFLQSLFGGALIGLAAVVLLLFNGRIAGISGIFGRLLQRDAGPGAWRAAFIAGLLLAAAVAHLAAWAPAPTLTGGLGLAALAGLVTGLGTGLANGCTSGHGVCGLSNLSLRSAVATVTFMAVAALTVFVTRHLV